MVGQEAVKNLQHLQRGSVILPQLRKNYVPVIYPKSFSQDEEPQFGAQPEEPWGSPEMNYALPPAIRAGQWSLSSEMSFECFQTWPCAGQVVQFQLLYTISIKF